MSVPSHYIILKAIRNLEQLWSPRRRNYSIPGGSSCNLLRRYISVSSSKPMSSLVTNPCWDQRGDHAYFMIAMPSALTHTQTQPITDSSMNSAPLSLCGQMFYEIIHILYIMDSTNVWLIACICFAFSVPYMQFLCSHKNCIGTPVDNCLVLFRVE